MLKHVEAGVLRIAYEENGEPTGVPVVLLHGFPYDIHAYDAVANRLISAGCHVFVPFLRGYGPTQFLTPDTLRSGQQAVLAQDLVSFMNVLGLEQPLLAGYDWGGRAACIVAALWPERVCGLVSGTGYNVQDIPGARMPAAPEDEYRLWYQYYFHGERGQAGLERHRSSLCKLLWQLWSPTWHFDDATYEQTASAFNNPDFVAVVIHSYRHRFGLVAGDPAAEDIERRLTAQPPITVPTIVLHGQEDGVTPVAGSERHDQHFKARYERRVIPGAGHNLPQEAPDDFAAAVLTLL